MSSTVTIRDVAAAAGVGISTVSRVVHRHPSVAQELRERVETAMRELGYEPDASAQSMRMRATHQIACAIRDSSIPEFAAFVRAAEAVIRQAGYTLLLTNIDESSEQERDLARMLGRRRVDGLMMTRSADGDKRVDEALTKLGIPVVYIDRDASPIADTVVIDHRHGIRAAVHHLAALGHSRIAFLTGRPTMRPARERLLAFEEAMAERGLPVDPRLVSAQSFYAEQAFQHASLVLTSEPRPSAIIAGGMSLLPAVLRAARMHNLQIGKDVSVIAGCNSDLAELSVPPVTAIRWDVPAWGRICAQLLLDRISAPPESAGGREIILPTELVIRESCGSLVRYPDRSTG